MPIGMEEVGRWTFLEELFLILNWSCIEIAKPLHFNCLMVLKLIYPFVELCDSEQVVHIVIEHVAMVS
jgi:hypothetical protein